MDVVRRVDHVAALVSEPHPLFGALTEQLGLPAMWEPFDALGWSSGGVSFGNLVLETLTPAPGNQVAVTLDGGGIATAFEPMPEAVRELDRRGIPRGFSFPYQGAPPPAEIVEMSCDPDVLPPWTTTMLGGFLGDDALEHALGELSAAGDEAAAAVIEMSRDPAAAAMIMAAGTPAKPWLFLCEYHDGRHESRRAAGRKALSEAGGGALGIKQVREVVYAVDDLEVERARWERLMDPLSASDELSWSFDGGPSVRVEAASSSPLQRIVCEVESVDDAARKLEALGALADRGTDFAVIEPRMLAGMRVSLVA